MRWNLFRRADIADAHGSSFESTVADEVAMARAIDPESAQQLDAVRSAAAAAASTALIVESESIGHVGRYALKTILGKGGLGTVYAAWDPLLSRTVALKTLHIDADPTARESLDALFLNEARAAAGLSHPHIVTVFDAGPSETGVYIAMERLQGQDLRHLLQQGVRPGPVEAAQVVRRIADALAYAHRKGVVHCDVKPANIFMTGRMHPKVLDFGIARVAHRDVPVLDGVVAGSPFYLAPEQIEGRSVDRRSDVYSLGVVLYELLCGKRPFDGKSIDEITTAVRSAELVPPHRVSPKVPLGLSVIACRAMERDPDQRYPSARHLSMELRHWLDSSEAGALRSEARGQARSKATGPSTAVRVARVAVPLFVVAIVAGVWWAKAMLAADATLPAAAAAAGRRAGVDAADAGRSRTGARGVGRGRGGGRRRCRRFRHRFGFCRRSRSGCQRRAGAARAASPGAVRRGRACRRADDPGRGTRRGRAPAQGDGRDRGRRRAVGTDRGRADRGHRAARGEPVGAGRGRWPADGHLAAARALDVVVRHAHHHRPQHRFPAV
jgi:serine/threonine-protein kinase